MSRNLAIFDLDGTLVDSQRDLADAGNAARAALGLEPLSVAAVQTMIGDGASKLIERLTPTSSADDRVRAMAAFRTDYANRLTNYTRLYPGIRELLQALRSRGWQIAVATNKPAVFAQPIVDRLNLQVDSLRGGEGAKKPDPAMIFEIMESLSAQAPQSWLIGDHHTDLAAARRAGIRSIWCSWGFGHRGEEIAQAEVATPADILPILTNG
ncbi:MAG: HAD-IA family hydrolase [Planctomycetota bacterium]